MQLQGLSTSSHLVGKYAIGVPSAKPDGQAGLGYSMAFSGCHFFNRPVGDLYGLSFLWRLKSCTA